MREFEQRAGFETIYKSEKVSDLEQSHHSENNTLQPAVTRQFPEKMDSPSGQAWVSVRPSWRRSTLTPAPVFERRPDSAWLLGLATCLTTVAHEA
jgi:hypothetical protein